MPPSRHSGSSFSRPSAPRSSSRPSSSGSFSRSSSSFGSSSRSSHPAPHSSSSYSKPVTPSYSRPTATPKPPVRPSASAMPRPSASNRRPRVNQPRYRTDLITPILRMCLNHEYLYFDKPWDYDGRHYEAGYYDENGNYYKNVAMKENEKTSVELECEYCGNRVKVEWKDGEMPTCSHCGAPMTLPSMETDTLNSETQYTAEEDAPARSQPREKTTLLGKMKKHPIITFVILVLICSLIKAAVSGSNEVTTPIYNGGTTVTQQDTRSNPEIFGKTIYLEKDGKGVYRRTQNSSSADKTIVWSADDESYYDSKTKAWAWYNNETAGGVWQYWFEGASSQYGDYGWMEYADGAWRVEKSAGNWITYSGDTSKFWHIEE